MGEQVVAEAWWVPVLGAIASGLLLVVGHYVRKLINSLLKRMDLADAEKEAIQLLLEGMAKQQPFVRQAKAAAADGKLTRDEIKGFEDQAWEYAKQVADGPAKQVIISWTEERVKSLIKQLLAKFKSGK